MEDAELDKYKKIVSDIESLRKGIKEYLCKGSDSVGDLSYSQALKELSRLRSLQRMTPRKIRERYEIFKP